MPQDQANQISKLHIGVPKIKMQGLEDAFKPDYFLNLIFTTIPVHCV